MHKWLKLPLAITAVGCVGYLVYTYVDLKPLTEKVRRLSDVKIGL